MFNASQVLTSIAIFFLTVSIVGFAIVYLLFHLAKKNEIRDKEAAAPPPAAFTSQSSTHELVAR
jgi:hypothetical protein